MSKVKNKREKGRRKPEPQVSTGTGRRKFLTLGLGGLGTLAFAGFAGYKAGWFDSNSATSTTAATQIPSLATGKSLPPVSLPADSQNALRAAEELVRHYSHELNNPSAVIHAVRAFGKNFTLKDGSRAIDFLCSKFAAEKEVGGKKYIYFPREAEVHDNSFLKTLLEAGASPDQQITAGGNKYTLRELGESAKALFRCDPKDLQRFDPGLVRQHLPWTLIAFSTLTPPAQPVWVNAYGEKIDLSEVIDSGLTAFEASCSDVGEKIAHSEDEPLEFRQEMAKYSCSGMHMYYGFFSCLKNGYRNNNLPERLRELFTDLIYRLEGDAKALKNETAVARQYGQQYIKGIGVGPDGRSMTKGSPPPQVIEVMGLRHLIVAMGHAFEAINYAQLHRLFTPTAEQKRRLQDGEQVLFESLVKLRATDLGPFFNWYEKFVSDLVIAVAHAVRGMKLLTRENPDAIAGNRSFGNES
jgi:hypothetical protein